MQAPKDASLPPFISFCRCRVDNKRGTIPPREALESIADNLIKDGWNCGCISSTDHDGRQFWVAAAEREDLGRFIVEADEKLTAFLELERQALTVTFYLESIHADPCR